MDLNTTEYNDIIRKIKIKRRIIGIVVALCFVGIIFSLPIYLEILGDVIIDLDGSPALIIVFSAAIIISLVAYIFISVPIHNSLLNECDAKKYIVMLTALEKEKNIYSMLSTGYFYLGDFDTSTYYSNKSLEAKSRYSKLAALFVKARCEFFSDRVEDFKRTVSEFNSLFANAKLSERQKAIISKYQNVTNLLSAILNKDNEKIKEFTIKLQPWEDTKIVNSFINYLKGVASYELGDKKESTYRFMAVCDVASKTVLGELSEKYLSEINKEKDTHNEEN